MVCQEYMNSRFYFLMGNLSMNRFKSKIYQINEMKTTKLNHHNVKKWLK